MCDGKNREGNTVDVDHESPVTKQSMNSVGGATNTNRMIRGRGPGPIDTHDTCREWTQNDYIEEIPLTYEEYYYDLHFS